MSVAGLQGKRESVSLSGVLRPPEKPGGKPVQDEHCYELGKSPFTSEDLLGLLTLIAKKISEAGAGELCI